MKFNDTVGIITGAEDNNNTVVAELTRGESTKEKQGFQSH